jgi:hypothetical protein
LEVGGIANGLFYFGKREPKIYWAGLRTARQRPVFAVAVHFLAFRALANKVLILQIDTMTTLEAEKPVKNP